MELMGIAQKECPLNKLVSEIISEEKEETAGCRSRHNSEDEYPLFISLKGAIVRAIAPQEDALKEHKEKIKNVY